MREDYEHELDISSEIGIAKPTIKVLAYTDDPVRVTDNTPAKEFGIFRLKAHLRAHAPTFADIDVKLISRNSVVAHAINKLDHVLKNQQFDEVWFFGLHQKDIPDFTLEFPKGGGPESELNQNEVDLLDGLMRSHGGNPGLGVLMAGDHANPPPDAVLKPSDDLFCPTGLDHKTFLGLGRAIGYKVPRAGLLRNWEGPPTHCANDSFNTQVFPQGADPEGVAFQMDSFPQHLNLVRFDPNGVPNPKGLPHQLFVDRNGQPIDVFPDHMHEGEVVIPGMFDPAIWPIGAVVRPLPRVVAEGTDKQKRRTLKIVAAYDGDTVGLGRVVADSSWHHYFNVNLNLLPANAPPGSDADRIGQYYANLAIWLAPLPVRQEMARLMFAWVSRHPLMMEEAGSGPLNIGTAAYRILLRVSSPCEINELLAAICPSDMRNKFESLNFPDRAISGGFPSKEVLLGAILEAYYYSLTNSSTNLRRADYPFVDLDSISRGFDRAFRLVADSLERSIIMAKAEQFGYTAILDRDLSNSKSFALSLEPYNCYTEGVVTFCDLLGTLTDPEDERDYPVAGRRGLTNEGHGFLRLELDFKNIRMRFAGVQTSPVDFEGGFIVVRRSDVARLDDGFNPEEGDTGTATGSQTLVTK
ncbi:MAG TPA: hypothetical protein VN956_22285 [Pyrinomonadaceae bacterium]|nr:hypothetical protein [Pyrinomonadaceae bacterium]